MSSSDRLSPPLRLLLRALLNIGLVWLLATYLNQYFLLTGGWKAVIIVGALLTLMNVIVRPLLAVITFPLKLLATGLAIVLVNALFVQLTYEIVLRMNSDIVTLQILGGMWGWVVVALVMGGGNWLMRISLK